MATARDRHYYIRRSSITRIVGAIPCGCPEALVITMSVATTMLRVPIGSLLFPGNSPHN
ncbi:MAG: hypothetical protein JO202_19165 [Ktedonobacteraceae bacterium]|nr:hypothetical protein [Ktedonobacteraceae bacterium]